MTIFYRDDRDTVADLKPDSKEIFHLDEDKLIITNREAEEIKKILETPFESDASSIFENFEDSNSE